MMEDDVFKVPDGMYAIGYAGEMIHTGKLDKDGNMLVMPLELIPPLSLRLKVHDGYKKVESDEVKPGDVAVTNEGHRLFVVYHDDTKTCCDVRYCTQYPEHNEFPYQHYFFNTGINHFERKIEMKFKVGDKVTPVLGGAHLGIATIVEAQEENAFPYKVRFSDGHFDRYKEEGLKLVENDSKTVAYDDAQIGDIVYAKNGAVGKVVERDDRDESECDDSDATVCVGYGNLGTYYIPPESIDHIERPDHKPEDRNSTSAKHPWWEGMKNKELNCKRIRVGYSDGTEIVGIADEKGLIGSICAEFSFGFASDVVCPCGDISSIELLPDVEVIPLDKAMADDVVVTQGGNRYTFKRYPRGDHFVECTAEDCNGAIVGVFDTDIDHVERVKQPKRKDGYYKYDGKVYHSTDGRLYENVCNACTGSVPQWRRVSHLANFERSMNGTLEYIGETLV